MKTALIRLDYIFAIVHADRNQAAQPDRRRRQHRWPIKPLRDVARLMGDELETRTLVRAGIVLTPLIALAAAFGESDWLQAMIVTMSAFIVMKTSGLAPLGVVLHAFAIVGGFLVLLAALSSPPLFVAATATMAAISILATAKGRELRSLGNFTFIPALYLACEQGERTQQVGLLAQGLAFLPYMAVAVAPLIVMAAAEHVGARDPSTNLFRHSRRLRRRGADDGPPAPFIEGMAAVALAVACAAALVEWRHIDHGQWVIWSAASVVTGDAASARRKLADRLMGAVLGVPVGVVAALMLPHFAVVPNAAAFGAMLTLVAFRRYPVGFAFRCGFAAIVLVDTGQSTLSAAARVENVVMGGLIGLAFVLGVDALSRSGFGRRGPRLQSDRPG